MNDGVTQATAETPYADLTPDLVLDAIEHQGWRCSGHLLALNSYENRVYQIGLDDGDFLIAKFYRPARWTDAQIQEEHAFLLELAEEDLPVVAPLLDESGASLMHYRDYRLTLFPRQGGHTPDLESLDNLRILGRCLGRMHAIGASRPFRHRVTMTAQRLGHESRAFLLESDFIPHEMRNAYESLTADLLTRIDRLNIPADGRIHGDCHPGNLLWRDGGPHFVDFDDSVTGPAVQDLWMLLTGEGDDQLLQLDAVLSGYETFNHFDARQLGLIEALRTLRIMHHVAWIGRRWSDPAFPLAFPYFAQERFWSEHILNLREQLAALDEPPLDVY